jgi:hypothetical protein
MPQGTMTKLGLIIVCAGFGALLVLKVILKDALPVQDIKDLTYLLLTVAGVGGAVAAGGIRRTQTRIEGKIDTLVNGKDQTDPK